MLCILCYNYRILNITKYRYKYIQLVIINVGINCAVIIIISMNK